MKRAVFIFLFVLACLSVSVGQNVRFGPYEIPSVSNQYPPLLQANLPPASPVPSICHSPANAVPCTNYATTYTYAGVACPNGAQDTPDPYSTTSACQSTGDALGNIGWWAPAGQYDYTVCIGTTCLGPYTVNVGSSAAGSGTLTGFTVQNNGVGQGTLSSGIPVLNFLSGCTSATLSGSTFAITCSGGGGSLSGMTAGQFPLAASAATVTSSVASTNTSYFPFQSLTTTGSSGAATLIGGVLNIPQYTGGGGGGVSGSGSGGYLPEWTGSGSSTALGNSPLSDTGSGGGSELQDPTGSYTLDMAYALFGSGYSPHGVGGSSIQVVTTPSAAGNCSSSDCYGISASMTAATVSNSTVAIDTPLRANVQNTGSSATQFGHIDAGYFLSQNDVSATLIQLNGIEVISGIGGGTGSSVVDQQAGGNFLSAVRDSAVTLNAGVLAGTKGPNSVSSVTTTDATFYGASPATVTGTMTHHYGLYLADQTTGGAGNADPWGIYEAAGKNFFGGSVTLGSGAAVTLTGATSGSYVKADGTGYGTPGGGGTTTNALTMNNSGSGASSGSSFNGAAAVTLSYNSIGAAPLASPTFTGTVTTPTLVIGSSTGVTSTSSANSQAVTCATGGTGTEVCDAAGNWVAHIAPSENVVSFSSTPTFSATASSNIITLTGNVTSSTLAAGTAGESMTMTVCQNSTGGFTFVWPSGMRGTMTIGSTASECSSQTFTYSGNQSAWLASSVGIANE
jgi:hypothetical protein